MNVFCMYDTEFGFLWNMEQFFPFAFEFIKVKYLIHSLGQETDFELHSLNFIYLFIFINAQAFLFLLPKSR